MLALSALAVKTMSHSRMKHVYYATLLFLGFREDPLNEPSQAANPYLWFFQAYNSPVQSTHLTIESRTHLGCYTNNYIGLCLAIHVDLVGRIHTG